MSTSPHPSHGYGRISRVLHWLTALAILMTAGLGLYMTGLPATTEAEVTAVFQAFSIHKTLGTGILALVILRLIWTLIHPGPGPLHPDRIWETGLARLIHRLLWGAMLVLPVSGWFFHASAPGFAPVLWPFGQSLPFIVPDETRALVFRSIHGLAGWCLIAFVTLHFLGAVKHVLVDRDATMARMTHGTGPAMAPAGPASMLTGLACLLWLAVIALGTLLAPEPEPDPFAAFPDPGEFGEPVMPQN